MATGTLQAYSRSVTRVIKTLVLLLIAFLLVVVAMAVGSGTGAVEKLALVAIAAILVFAASKVWRFSPHRPSSHPG
ncbi:MAG: hypothetical protein QOE05_2560 [Actinomycetota bacterium]|jgi:membrane protein YdbS with pleckstrin-like domain|nr:hypothetical protein [Actinomycetota bacterium]